MTASGKKVGVHRFLFRWGYTRWGMWLLLFATGVIDVFDVIHSVHFTICMRTGSWFSFRCLVSQQFAVNRRQTLVIVRRFCFLLASSTR